MSERHCPGCHGHLYDELDGFDPCDEHGRWEERSECHGLPPCPECERLKEKCNQLNAEVERLAECRCTDHTAAPAVDGCGVCVRQNLVSAIEILREVEAQWGEEYLWSKHGLSKAITVLDEGKETQP